MVYKTHFLNHKVSRLHKVQVTHIHLPLEITTTAVVMRYHHLQYIFFSIPKLRTKETERKRKGKRRITTFDLIHSKLMQDLRLQVLSIGCYLFKLFFI